MKKPIKNVRTEQRARRRRRIRVLVSGTAERPRLSVFRSNTGLYLQLIDDVRSATVASASSRETKEKKALDGAKAAGRLIGERAKAAGVKKAVFDRSGYVYAGKVKAAAEGAREAGLEF